MYEMTLGAEFDVVTADRGRDGLRLAATNHPDAILLDVLMPGMDGWETCTRLKSDPATESIPVILLTGVTDIDLTDHAMAVGACDVITKPCSPDRLLATIQKVLRRRMYISVRLQADLEKSAKTPCPNPPASRLPNVRWAM